MQLVSPAAADLFDRAILQSPVGPGALRPLRTPGGGLIPAEAIGQRFAAKLGIAPGRSGRGRPGRPACRQSGSPPGRPRISGPKRPWRWRASCSARSSTAVVIPRPSRDADPGWPAAQKAPRHRDHDQRGIPVRACLGPAPGYQPGLPGPGGKALRPRGRPCPGPAAGHGGTVVAGWGAAAHGALVRDVDRVFGPGVGPGRHALLALPFCQGAAGIRPGCAGRRGATWRISPRTRPACPTAPSCFRYLALPAGFWAFPARIRRFPG